MSCQLWIPENVDEVMGFVSKSAEVDFGTPDTWFQLVLVTKATDEIVGDIGLRFPANKPEQVEIGGTLSVPCQHKGYATEALAAILDYLFVKMEQHRAFASTHPTNKTAIALLERMGMRQEAHFHRSLRVRGEWVDDVIYAMLRDEMLEK
jgi:RimJ/RimL family protein N-acetyltransferase